MVSVLCYPKRMANNYKKEQQKSRTEGLQRRLDRLLSHSNYTLWPALEEKWTYGEETLYDCLWSDFKRISSRAPDGGCEATHMIVDKLEKIIASQKEKTKKQMEQWRREDELAKAKYALEIANYVHKPKHPIKRLKQ